MMRSVAAAQMFGQFGPFASPLVSTLEASAKGFASFPSPAGSKIKTALKAGAGGAVDATVAVGGAKATVSVTEDSIRAAQGTPTQLHEVARISVLHSSLQKHLLRLLQERFSVLAQYPDFAQYFGKDYYYRAHPDTVGDFYALVDEYHRMYDTATEFESLSHLALDLIPAHRARLLNPVHPAITPTTANSAVTAFLLGLK
jgi:hypothetical protein